MSDRKSIQHAVYTKYCNYICTLCTIIYLLELRICREGLVHADSQARGRTFEPLLTMPRAFFFAPQHVSKKGIWARWHKLELELDEFLEPSQLSGPSPEAKVHCVVTAMNDKGHRYFNYQIADGKTFHWHSVASRPLPLSSSLSVPELCQPREMYDKRSTVYAHCVNCIPRRDTYIHT